MRNYFLSYKDLPGNKADTEITHTYGIDEAYEVIKRSQDDYNERFNNLENMLSI